MFFDNVFLGVLFFLKEKEGTKMTPKYVWNVWLETKVHCISYLFLASLIYFVGTTKIIPTDLETLFDITAMFLLYDLVRRQTCSKHKALLMVGINSILLFYIIPIVVPIYELIFPFFFKV